MKIEVIDSRTFAVDGNRYQRGDYSPQYRNQSVKLVHEQTGHIIGGGIDFTPWTKFKDSSNAAYADYATFVTALSTIIQPADAETTISNDKGTVTQLTSKTTGVTLSKLNGVITTVALSDAADTGFEFTVTNTKVAATSNVQLTPIYAGTQGVINARIKSVADGSFVVVVTNSGTQALNAVAKIAFVVF